MQQTVTFCLPDQVHAKDVALYERLFLAHNFLRAFIYCCTVDKTEKIIIDAETENNFFFFIIIYSVMVTAIFVYIIVPYNSSLVFVLIFYLKGVRVPVC